MVLLSLTRGTTRSDPSPKVELLSQVRHTTKVTPSERQLLSRVRQTTSDPSLGRARATLGKCIISAQTRIRSCPKSYAILCNVLHKVISCRDLPKVVQNPRSVKSLPTHPSHLKCHLQPYKTLYMNDLRLWDDSNSYCSCTEPATRYQQVT